MSTDSRSAGSGDELDGLTADEWFSAEPADDAPEDSSVRRVRLSTTDPYESNQLLQRELQRRRHVVEQLRILASAVSASCDGVAILTPEITGPRIAYVNRGFCAITGRKPEETIGASIEAFGLIEDDPFCIVIQQRVLQQKAFSGETLAVRCDGSEFALEIDLSPVLDEDDGSLTHWVAFLRDVTEKRARVLTLEKQALHDVLTSLPNRLLFLDRLEHAIVTGERERERFAVMIMDLDRFKEVNDAFGHHAGDLLLQQVANRLRGQVRASDTVARLGGDEFALLLPGVGDANVAMAMADKLLGALTAPFLIEERMIDVGASIGVVLWPQHGGDATILLRRADSAMYRAKTTNAGVVLHHSMQRDGDSSSLTLAADLRKAIEEEQLVLYYQPKVHIRSGVATRMEVLVRWNHPTEGLLSPVTFIPLAERTGLIKPMTNWILDQALKQCRDWHDRGIPLHLAINVSTRSLQETFLAETVQEALERWGVEPRCLKLEITESSILADPPQVTAVLSLLQTLGVRLSIDDFGTGYSSLVHLRQLAVDEIKIDKSFVKDMCSDESDAAIVKATIDLAHSLGRQVVAEGVEDEATLNALRDLGCDLAQGYFYTPPIPAEELERWLEKTQWGMTPRNK